jgi:hypothetical protein
LTQTIVTFLLDRTGSMQSCKAATIEAFNAYLDTLKKNAEGIEFSFLQFDSQSLDKICIAEHPGNVAFLTDASYQPRGSTPLIDASYKTIKAVETALAKRDDKPQIVICIQTDGYENASTEHSMADLNLLIKEKTGLGWQFVFMGAGIDAYTQGAQMGVPAAQTMSYDPSRKETTEAAFRASAHNTVEFARRMMPSAAFSAPQRAASGDSFVNRVKSLAKGLSNPPAKDGKSEKRPIVDDITLN